MMYSTIIGAALLYGASSQVDLSCNVDADCAALDTYVGLNLIPAATYVCNPNPNLKQCTAQCADDTICNELVTALESLGTSVSLSCSNNYGQSVCDADSSCTTSDECVTKGLDAFGYSYCDGSNCVAPPTASPVTKTPTLTKMPTQSPVVVLTCEEENNCAAAGSDVWHCSTGDDAYLAMSGVDCQEEANACYARCALEAGVDEAKTTQPSIAPLLDQHIAAEYGNVDGMFDAICAAGTCPIPTPAPTPDGTTTEPPTYDCTQCATYGTDPYFCSTAETTIYSFFPLDCDDADNECYAKCMIADSYEAELAALQASNPDNAAFVENFVATNGGVDGLFDDYCTRGTCQGGATPETTEECSCDTNCWNAEDCRDPAGSGCSIQLNATLDFCLIDARWSLSAVWETLVDTYIDAFDALVPDHSGFCGSADLKFELWQIEYLTSSAYSRARGGPKSAADCGDIKLDQICGSTRDSPQFRITMSVGFFCGSCKDTQTVLLALKTVLDADQKCYSSGSSSSCDDDFGGQVVSNCVAQGIAHDPVCSGTLVAGFGGVAFEVEEATIAYRDADGKIVGDVTSLTGAAGRCLYGVAVVVALVMTLLR